MGSPGAGIPREKPSDVPCGADAHVQDSAREPSNEGPDMEKLSQILWRERELLETLLFKLEEEQMVLAGGRTRWLARAAREVENVLDTIRETEILRAVCRRVNLLDPIDALTHNAELLDRAEMLFAQLPPTPPPPPAATVLAAMRG